MSVMGLQRELNVLEASIWTLFNDNRMPFSAIDTALGLYEGQARLTIVALWEEDSCTIRHK